MRTVIWKKNLFSTVYFLKFDNIINFKQKILKFFITLSPYNSDKLLNFFKSTTCCSFRAFVRRVIPAFVFLKLLSAFSFNFCFIGKFYKFVKKQTYYYAFYEQ